MSTRSLGSLTLDLIARIGGFKQGMNQAQQAASESSRKIRTTLNQNIGAGFSDVNESIQGFTRNLIGMAAVFQGVRVAIGAADAWTGLNNRIKLVTDSTESFQQAQSSIIGIAKETRQSLTATAELYQRIAQNQKELRLSGQEVADIVETISKTMVISGASAGAAEGALIQLGQAFASGTLRGQELNSVMEQAPALAKAIADGLGIPIGRLRELSQAGELSADAVINALQRQAGAVDKSFGNIAITVGGAMENMRTSITETVGRLDSAVGASAALGNSIRLLSENLVPAASAFAAFATVKVAQNLGERVTAMAKNRTELIASAKAAVTAAQATELQTRAELNYARAAAAAATARMGGSVSLNLQAAEATLKHRQATIALTAAQANAAAATNVLGGALKSTLAFFGGPVGLALMVATTAASWLVFSDNNSAANRALLDFNGTMDDTISKFRELNQQQQAGEIVRLNKEISDTYKEISGNIDEISLRLALAGSQGVQQFKSETEDLGNQFRAGRISADQFSQAVEDAGKRALESAGGAKEFYSRIVEGGAAVGAASREYARQNDLLRTFTGEQGKAATATDGTTDAIRAQERALAAGQKSLNDYIGKMGEMIASGRRSLIQKTQGEFAALQFDVGMQINQAGGLGALTPEQRSAINEFLGTRKQQIAAEEQWTQAQKDSRAGAKASKKDSDDLKKAYDSLLESMRERIALFGNESEAARVAYQVENGELAKLTQSQKDNLIERAKLIDKMNEQLRISEEIKRATEEESENMRANKQAISDYLGDLEFELELMKMTNVERERAIAMRQLGIEQGSETDQILTSYLQQNEAIRQQIELMDTVRDAGRGFLNDMFNGTKSFKDAITDAFDQIHKKILDMIAENLMNQLFGQQGQQGGGAAGNWMANLAGAFFGGRAGGGSVKPWSIYQVNETGMEGLSVNGKDYLMTGSQSGIVQSNPRTGQQMITNNLTVNGRIDRRSEQRIAREIAQQTRLAAARA